MRIDQFLVENGYFNSRSKAQRAINDGAILVNNKIVNKASLEIVDSNVDIKILDNVMPYVSQGGLKLEGAINSFKLDFTNKVVLDIGSSTGGFTDCSLKHNASFVYAVDVGTNQLDESLRTNEKIKLLENTNILDLPKFDKNIDIIVTDVSFISLTKIIPAFLNYLNDDNYLVCLIKPQFEVGKQRFKNGVIKDKKVHLEVLKNISQKFSEVGLYINKVIKSPQKGGSGNQEFLALVTKQFMCEIDFRKVIE